VYPNREVFPEAPLALVAAEIRFTDVARLRQQQTRDEVTLALEPRFPFAEPLRQADINLKPVGPGIQIQERVGVVLKNATSTETLTITSRSLTYETTAYTSFDELLDTLSVACDMLVAANVRPAVRRIGLRYVNEVRVPEAIIDARQWGKWIDSRLVGPLVVGSDDLPAMTTQSVSTFDLGEGRGLNFRCAALNQGPIVVPEFLKRPPIESGPFFVLDFDGFHDFTGGEAVSLNSEVVREALSAVHVPCGSAFQRSITDEARMLFRGAQP
jgi:uncharacterized protein (TIGR04255 family)